ncbi:unnamed protein product [Lactuca saligna]|uniref:Uncharacterized protein n=1 Tax=Lactuca saligna TaxID=75948 RepID=A0AA35Y9K0_LACSI|nr:unnamed protein product [Lactuca saligna]
MQSPRHSSFTISFLLYVCVYGYQGLAIATRIQFGNLAKRDPDPAPELTNAEHDVIKRPIASYFVCSDPDESTLSLADLDSTYSAPATVSVPNLRGDDLSLLERLQRKRRFKVINVGSSSTPKSEPSSDVDVRGQA